MYPNPFAPYGSFGSGAGWLPDPIKFRRHNLRRRSPSASAYFDDFCHMRGSRSRSHNQEHKRSSHSHSAHFQHEEDENYEVEETTTIITTTAIEEEEEYVTAQQRTEVANYFINACAQNGQTVEQARMISQIIMAGEADDLVKKQFEKMEKGTVVKIAQGLSVPKLIEKPDPQLQFGHQQFTQGFQQHEQTPSPPPPSFQQYGQQQVAYQQCAPNFQVQQSTPPAQPLPQPIQQQVHLQQQQHTPPATTAQIYQLQHQNVQKYGYQSCPPAWSSSQLHPQQHGYHQQAFQPFQQSTLTPSPPSAPLRQRTPPSAPLVSPPPVLMSPQTREAGYGVGTGLWGVHQTVITTNMSGSASAGASAMILTSSSSTAAQSAMTQQLQLQQQMAQQMTLKQKKLASSSKRAAQQILRGETQFAPPVDVGGQRQLVQQMGQLYLSGVPRGEPGCFAPALDAAGQCQVPQTTLGIQFPAAFGQVKSEKKEEEKRKENINEKGRDDNKYEKDRSEKKHKRSEKDRTEVKERYLEKREKNSRRK